ncbi:MAG: APC family permease [Conexivisphaerales archaeon]
MVERLQGNALSFWQLMFYAVAIMFPASAFAITGSTAMLYSGSVAPMAFLVGGLILILAIVAVYYYSKKIATPGGYYKFVERSVSNIYLSKSIGLLQILYNVAIMAFTSILGGWLLWVATTTIYGLSLPLYLIILVSLIGPIIYLVVGYRSISISGNLAIGISMLEIIVFGALSIYFIIISPNNNINYFNIANSSGGLGGFFAAVVVGGFMTYSGYGSIVMFGEESKTPLSTIRKAIVTAAIIIIGIDVLELYSIVSIAGTTLSTGMSYFAPGFYYVKEYLGGVILLFAFIIVEIAQIMAPVFNGNSTARIFLSLSRDGVLPASISKIHPKFKSPYVAVITVFIITAITTILGLIVFVHYLGMSEGTFYAWAFFGTFISIIWWVYHVVTNETLGFLYKHIKQLKIIPHIVLPAISTATFIFAGYYSVLGLSWPLSLVYYVIPIWIILGLIYIYLRRKKIKMDELETANKEPSDGR